MPRNLGDLPRAQLGEDALGQRLALAAQARDLFVDVDLGIVADEAQLFDLGFELGDRLFEIEEFQIHDEGEFT